MAVFLILRSSLNCHFRSLISLFWSAIFISALVQEFTAAYGGYSRLAIVLIGRDWLIYTLFFAVLVASHPWKNEPRERMLT